MTDTLNLTRGGQLALEREMLARLVAAGGTSTLREMFDGFRPRWACEALDRLEDRGLVRLLPDRRTAVTARGFAEYESSRERARVERPCTRTR